LILQDPLLTICLHRRIWRNIDVFNNLQLLDHKRHTLRFTDVRFPDGFQGREQQAFPDHNGQFVETLQLLEGFDLDRGEHAVLDRLLGQVAEDVVIGKELVAVLAQLSDDDIGLMAVAQEPQDLCKKVL
jgi:hypothetical protein